MLDLSAALILHCRLSGSCPETDFGENRFMISAKPTSGPHNFEVARKPPATTQTAALLTNRRLDLPPHEAEGSVNSAPAARKGMTEEAR
jgi:hypothetical protein